MFETPNAAYYHADLSRSNEVIKTEIAFRDQDKFPPISVIDAYPAYLNMVEVKQFCWAHLLRDSKEVEDICFAALTGLTMMIEQPLAYTDMLLHRKLQNEINTPICLDESIHDPENAKLALEYDCCRIINIKLGRVGGYYNALKIAKDAGPGKVWCGGQLETGIGRIHNLCLQANLNFTIPGDTSASDRYYAKDIIDPEVVVNSKGYITVPKGKGLGIEVREDHISEYTIQSVSLEM